jgi:hypothetical protein
MPFLVSISTRVRSDPAGLTERGDEVAVALAKAVRRALERSRKEVLDRSASGRRVRLHAPEWAWTGPSAGEVSGDDRRRLEALLSDAVQRAIAASGIGESPNGLADAAPPAGDVGEPFDESRYDPVGQTYAIPSYQPRPKPGEPTGVPVQSASGVPATEDFSNLAGASDDTIKAVKGRLYKGEVGAFTQVMLDESDEGFAVLVDLAKRAPGVFLTLFRAFLKKRGEVSALRVRRLDDNFEVGTFELGQTRRFDARTRAVLDQIPLARQVIAEREALLPGLMRLFGLIGALMQVRSELLEYLKSVNSTEPTKPELLQDLDEHTKQLPTFFSMFVELAGTPPAKGLLADFLKDVVEDIRLVQYVLQRVREIDAQLAIYRMFYGDKGEEVPELIESRLKYLRTVSRHFVPTVAKAALLIREANETYDGWRGRAGAAKLKKAEDAFWTLWTLYTKNPIQTSGYGGGRTAEEGAYNPKAIGLGDALKKTFEEIQKLNKETNRGEGFYKAVQTIEHSIPLMSVQFQLLHIWFATIDIYNTVHAKEVGDKTEREGWLPGTVEAIPGWKQRLETIRNEVIAQYDKPDYAKLNDSFKDWSDRIAKIQAEINHALKVEFWKTLGITIFATIVTFGAGAALGGGVTFAVILGEATVFTAVTTIGTAVLLDKSIDPGDVVGQFAENALMFGAFKGLGLGISAVAKAWFPGRVLTQLAFSFGANALVTAGVPVVTSLLETRTVSEETRTFIVANLIVSTLMSVIGGAKNVMKLRQMAKEGKLNASIALDIAKQFETHSAEAAEIMKLLEKFTSDPDMSQADFEQLKKRAGEKFPEFEKLLNRLAGTEFSKEVLAMLGLTREQAMEMANMVKQANGFIQDATYNPPPKTKALPPPPASLKLTRTGPGTYEYNPSAVGQHTGELVAKLRGLGFTVTDEGGGVLKITLSGFDGMSNLLLPAAEPGATNFDRPLLDRALGPRTDVERARVVGDLEKIFPDLTKLLGQYADAPALAALELLVENAAKLPGGWSEEAVKGLVEMLKLERGVGRTAVRRLIQTLPPDQVPKVLELYLKLTTEPRTKSLADFIISSTIPTGDSVRLLEVCTKLGDKRFEFPSDMSRKAVEGLLSWVREALDVDKLTDSEKIAEKIAERFRKDPGLEARLKNLEAAAPAKGSKPTDLQNEIDRHSKPVRPGLTLVGANPSEVVEAILTAAKDKGGKFSEASERMIFERAIAQYQIEVGRIEAYTELNNKAYGQISRANGALNEILVVIAALESGAEVFASGKPIGETGKTRVRLTINLSTFKLPGDIGITNVDEQTEVQLDIGYKTVEGKIVVAEVTTAHLSMPEGLEVLLKGGGGSIDFKALRGQDPVGGPKFQQMIKLRAARMVAEGVAAGFQALSGNTATIPPPEMVIRVKSATPDAIKAATLLGFKVEVTGTTGKK